jgi:hypothetical protein
MVFAELMLDPETSHFAYRLREEFPNVSDVDFPVGKRAAFDMIHSGSFGDPGRARTAAREVVAWAREDHSLESFPVLINAAIAQYRIASAQEAEETIRFALGRARRNEFVLAETNLMLTLARLFWSTERLEQCIAQYLPLADLVAQCSDTEIIVDYCILGARLATAQGRYDDAAAQIARARGFPHSQLPLPDLLLRCCELELRLATGDDPVSDAEVNDLLSLHYRARGFGLHDEVMATVLKCLDRNHRGEEATMLLHEYVSDHRRDGFPVPSWLAKRITQPRMARSQLLAAAAQ